MQKFNKQDLEKLIPKIELVSISDIKLNPDNPRTISEKRFKALVKSVSEFWIMLFLRPVVLNEDGMALGGNQRTLAARKAGLSLIPCIRAKHLTPAQQRQFIIKDNNPSGSWDLDALANNWDQEDLADWDLELKPWESNPDFFDDRGNEEDPAKKRNLVTGDRDGPPSGFNIVVKADTELGRQKIITLLQKSKLVIDKDFFVL